jgi:hypothetical protein
MSMIMGWAEHIACAGAMEIGLQYILQVLNLKEKVPYDLTPTKAQYGRVILKRI